MQHADYSSTELITRFDAMVEVLAELAAQLEQSSLPLWIPLSDAEQQCHSTPIHPHRKAIDPRRKAIELYCDLWHQSHGDGRRTRSCHGLIAASHELLATAQQANRAKNDFRQTLAAIKAQALPQSDNAAQQTQALLERVNQRPNALRQALGYNGLARLHLKQCYRLIPVIERQPLRVGLNWYTSGRSIKRFSQQQAQQALTKMGLDKPHIQLQLDRLSQLNADTKLAQVQQQSPLMRANLSFDRAPLRQAMNLSLPLLFAYDPQLPFPQHNSPSLTPQTERQRQIRSDCRIDPEPFLPSLRLHLYR